jgi:hypothetical protein
MEALLSAVLLDALALGAGIGQPSGRSSLVISALPCP